MQLSYLQVDLFIQVLQVLTAFAKASADKVGLKILFPLISNTLKIDEYLPVTKFENTTKML
jgi:hypothetical protein